MVPFPLPEYFSDIHCEHVVEIQEVKLTDVWDPLMTEFVTLRVVHAKPPAIPQLQFRFSYPALVPAEVSTLGSCDSLYSPVGLSSLGSLPCDPTFLTDLRRVVDFPLCSASLSAVFSVWIPLPPDPQHCTFTSFQINMDPPLLLSSPALENLGVRWKEPGPLSHNCNWILWEKKTFVG